MRFLLLAVLSSLVDFTAISQEKLKIDHTAYDDWKSIRRLSQSPSGIWVAYEVAPLEGDAELVIESVENAQKKIFPRGKNAVFMKNETIVVFMIEPQFDTVRKLRLDEVPKDKLPKDSLAIYWTGTDSVKKIDNVKSFRIAEEGTWIAYLSTKDLRPECPKDQSKRQKKKNPCSRPPTSGSTLTLYNPVTGVAKEIHSVTSYELSKDGNFVGYIKSHKGTKDTLSCYVMDLRSLSETQQLDQQYAISQVTFDEKSTQLAFLASADTNETKNVTLYYTRVEVQKPLIIADSNTVGMPAGWTVSEHGRVYFSENGERLFFGTNKISRQQPEDTLLENEKAKVDVWGANDPRIQPQQLMEQSGDEKKSYLAMVTTSSGDFVQLANKQVQSVRLTGKGNGAKALGIDDQPYYREITWEYPWKSDYYIINLVNGGHSLLKKGQAFTASLSPSGDYFIYYNGADSAWYSINTTTNEEQNLTRQINALFAMDNNGTPSLADEEGFNGWTMIGGKEYCLVKSRYDTWALNPAVPQESFSPTGEKGIKEGIKFSYYRLDYDSTYTRLDINFFIGQNDLTKAETIYRIVPEDGRYTVEALLTSDHSIALISKAEKSDRVILRRMSFIDYPDLEKTTIAFDDPEKFTNINPQQRLYNWGTVEMVSWQTYAGRNLRGLLYKPEDFDSTKSYPMIVYFYEKYTDDIHLHYVPKPTASIVYPTEYVSNGYIIFIPDIEYTPGYPAQSAYDCIVSGTDYLIRRYSWIDSTRLGLQGQSWGGYQVAQLITMTNKYKAAMAGAPVSNMTSAYGGIRWGSGLSRMFQYEKTQSRIGYTLWEKPDLYLLNSPVFGLPYVNTPLLIMSNDGDGAVPWYQGIELYMGLRRLGKPAWLLNYNGDEHNLVQLANKRDLSIRMRQFFDYYLLGAPMPVWMSQGIPATEKGSTYGFEPEKSGN